MYNVMIVEDEEKLNLLIKNHLERYGYKTCSVDDFSDIKAEFIKKAPQLVLIDINLPFFDGFYWCREIRSISNVPIIFVSARDSDMDLVMAIENGGDEYINKPFSYDVLLAKIKGVLRRTYGMYSEKGMDIYNSHGITVYINQNIIEFKDKKIELSKNEFLIFYSLIKNINKIVSRNMLLETLWNDIDFIDDNTLSVNVTRLRKRLCEIGMENCIETRRGQGYILIDNWNQ